MTNDLGSLVERLVGDVRYRIGGAIVGGLVMVISLAAGGLDLGPKFKKSTVALAPEVSPNVPLLRFWPYPNPAVDEARLEALRRGPVKGAAPRVMTARR